MKVLITGIAGFLGHHLAQYLMDNTNWDIVGIDRIDSAGNLNRLKEIEYFNKHRFVFHDFRAEYNNLIKSQIGDINIIFHVGASSHVDRSILFPMEFVYDNVVGTVNTLEYAKSLPNLDAFFYFSTDEVYGSTDNGKFTEWDRYNSGNPYSASKASGEEFCLAYHNTYNLPIIITHCMNIYGERQHPEKFIPKLIRYIDSGLTVPIYASKDLKISGSRNYIYARTVCDALLHIYHSGNFGDKYNIEGTVEKSNLEIAQSVADIMGKKLKYTMVASDNVRPGNDFAYGVDGSKLRSMGFENKENFSNKLEDVVKWYLDNPRWYKL